MNLNDLFVSDDGEIREFPGAGERVDDAMIVPEFPPVSRWAETRTAESEALIVQRVFHPLRGFPEPLLEGIATLMGSKDEAQDLAQQLFQALQLLLFEPPHPASFPSPQRQEVWDLYRRARDVPWIDDRKRER